MQNMVAANMIRGKERSSDFPLQGKGAHDLLSFQMHNVLKRSQGTNEAQNAQNRQSSR